jgi:hypothetical protein
MGSILGKAPNILRVDEVAVTVDSTFSMILLIGPGEDDDRTWILYSFARKT